MNLRTCLLLAFASSAVAKFDFDFVKGTAADTDSTPDDTDFSFLPKWLVRLGPRPPVAAHHEQAACEPTYAPHHRTPGYRRRSRHEARAEHRRPCLVGLAAPGALWSAPCAASVRGHWVRLQGGLRRPESGLAAGSGVARPCMWHMLGGRTGREHDWVYAARRVAWTMRTEPPGLQHPRMSRPHAPGSKRRGSHPGSFGLDPRPHWLRGVMTRERTLAHYIERDLLNAPAWGRTGRHAAHPDRH